MLKYTQYTFDGVTDSSFFVLMKGYFTLNDEKSKFEVQGF